MKCFDVDADDEMDMGVHLEVYISSWSLTI